MRYAAQINQGKADYDHYAAWMKVFKEERVPLLSPRKYPNTSVFHSTAVDWYRVDVSALSQEQIQRYLVHCTKDLGLSLSQVRDNLYDPDRGLAVLTEGVEIVLETGMEGAAQ